MTSWFTNGWLRLGSKKRSQMKDENNKENEGDSYPKMKKGALANLQLERDARER